MVLVESEIVASSGISKVVCEQVIGQHDSHMSPVNIFVNRSMSTLKSLYIHSSY